jgi:hypothetical protein
LAAEDADHMTTDLLEPKMAGEKPKTLSAKLHVDVIESARIVAAFRNESITDLLSEILRPALAQMEKEEIAKRGKGAKG